MTSSASLDTLSRNVNDEARVVMDKKKKTKKKRAEGRPKRPLSAYNIFFQVARARILTGDSKLVTIDTLRRHDLVDLVIERKSANNPTKRGKGASVKMGFKGLATIIANKWKFLQPTTKALFVERASIEKDKFKRELDHWLLLQPGGKNGKISPPSKRKGLNTLFHMQLVNKESKSPELLSSIGTQFLEQSIGSTNLEQQGPELIMQRHNSTLTSEEKKKGLEDIILNKNKEILHKEAKARSQLLQQYQENANTNLRLREALMYQPISLDSSRYALHHDHGHPPMLPGAKHFVFDRAYPGFPNNAGRDPFDNLMTDGFQDGWNHLTAHSLHYEPRSIVPETLFPPEEPLTTLGQHLRLVSPSESTFILDNPSDHQPKLPNMQCEVNMDTKADETICSISSIAEELQDESGWNPSTLLSEPIDEAIQWDARFLHYTIDFGHGPFE